MAHHHDRFLKRPFQYGSITLPNNIFYAPLAGCSDLPFREMGSAYRPGLHFCEMVKMDALIRGDVGTFRLLDYTEGMHPIGAQLVGSNPKIAGKSAKILEELGFDVIDLNCGCPVDKITKDGSGSGLLRQPEKIGEIVSEIKAAVKVPVSVKIRMGWTEEELVGPQITQIAEAAGAVSICVHGRTRKQGYNGNAKWDWIKECKEAAKEILVLANGDLFSGEAVQKVFEQTDCDGVVISRGTMGSPWIVEEMIEYLTTGKATPKTAEEYKQTLLDHFDKVLHYHNDKKAVIDARRIGCWYIKSTSGAKQFRQKMSRAADVEEVKEIIHDFCFHGS